jgi:hypothetical protein
VRTDALPLHFRKRYHAELLPRSRRALPTVGSASPPAESRRAI